MRSTSVRTLLVVAAVLCLAGCSTEHHVTGPLSRLISEPAPTPNSPQAAIRLFQWGWNYRQLGAIRDVLTDDFSFVFAPDDSSGNLFPDHRMNREELLFCLAHLFTGGGPAPPATSIHLVLDPALIALPDSRSGRNPRWHKEILTSVDLTIKTEDLTEYRILGNARFFVVRGDSALIPGELGFEPDSSRWYIQQWNDETLTAGGALARALPATPQPSVNPTWGRILAYYYPGRRR
jgi:hypothetical protein